MTAGRGSTTKELVRLEEGRCLRQRLFQIYFLAAEPEVLRASLCGSVHGSTHCRWVRWAAPTHIRIQIQSQEHLIEQQDIFATACTFESIEQRWIVKTIWIVSFGLLVFAARKNSVRPEIIPFRMPPKSVFVRLGCGIVGARPEKKRF